MYLAIVAVVTLIFGVGFLLLPATMLKTYGSLDEPHVNLSTQFFGAALISLGLL
jgi:hypothetical protein